MSWRTRASQAGQRGPRAVVSRAGVSLGGISSSMVALRIIARESLQIANRKSMSWVTKCATCANIASVGSEIEVWQRGSAIQRQTRARRASWARQWGGQRVKASGLFPFAFEDFARLEIDEMNAGARQTLHRFIISIGRGLNPVLDVLVGHRAGEDQVFHAFICAAACRRWFQGSRTKPHATDL